jgi:DNA-binding XRE family transcriptional regulator
MKDTETKLACFELRAQGKSLTSIADTVGVRRQTVANWLNEHGMGAGMHPGMEFALSLMDVNEEIKMLEEYRDALQARLEKVNKRLEGLRSGSST